MSSRSPSPRRRKRRGAPLGNTNALVHGFYAKKLPPADINDLEGHTFSGLSEEIQATRVILRRLLEINNNCTDPDRAVSQVRVYSLAAATLGRLMRTEMILSPNTSDNLFKTALSELYDELGIDAEDAD